MMATLLWLHYNAMDTLDQKIGKVYLWLLIDLVLDASQQIKMSLF